MSEKDKGTVEIRDGKMIIDVPSAITDDALVLASRRAMERIEAVKQIKVMALAVTNPSDWTDQAGKPYIQASGAEKIANLFNVSWTLDEPSIEFEDDGHFTYIYRGTFRMPGREITADGARSSKDPFFKKYDYRDKIVDGKPVVVNGQKVRERFEKPISDIDKRDVRIAAMTNCLGNGISRILGIRNLTWEDLKVYANIDQKDVSRVEYKDKKKAEEEQRRKMREPQEKGQKSAPASASAATPSQGSAEKATTQQVETLKKLLAKGGIPENGWAKYCADFIGAGVSLTKIEDMSSKHAGGIILALQGEQSELG